MINFKQMINPLGPSPKALEAIKESIHLIHKYTGSSPKLIQRIAEINNLKEDQVMISDGADGALTLIAQSVFKNNQIVIPQPCFHRYKDYPSYLEVNYTLIKPKDNLLLDENEILKSKGNILLLASPNNPTGFTVSDDFLIKALDKFKRVILDETLLLSLNGKENLIEKFPNLIIVRSFSKLGGLAGLRVGYIISSTENIKKIKTVSTPFKVNCLGQVAALAVLDDENYLEQTQNIIEQERNRLYETLRNKNIRNSQSLCYCLFLTKEQQEALANNNILIQEDMEFGYNQNKEFLFRLTINNTENNNTLIETIKAGERNDS